MFGKLSWDGLLAVSQSQRLGHEMLGSSSNTETGKSWDSFPVMVDTDWHGLTRISWKHRTTNHDMKRSPFFQVLQFGHGEKNTRRPGGCSRVRWARHFLSSVLEGPGRSGDALSGLIVNSVGNCTHGGFREWGCLQSSSIYRQMFDYKPSNYWSTTMTMEISWHALANSSVHCTDDQLEFNPSGWNEQKTRTNHSRTSSNLGSIS